MSSEILPPDKKLPPEKDFTFPSPKPPKHQDEDEHQEGKKDGPSKTRREHAREYREKEVNEEFTLQGQFLDLVAKNSTLQESEKQKFLELFLKLMSKEGQRRNDFELSQRQYMWFMMADKERDMGHIRDLVTGFLDLANKYGEMKQQDAKSVVGEVTEVVTAVLQIPIFVELQTMLTDAIRERQRKKQRLKDPHREKLRRELQRKLDALLAEDEGDNEE